MTRAVEDAAYAAGFFDGEGNIGIRTRRNERNFQMEVRITNTDRAVLEWFAERWGGKIYGNRQPKRNRREAFTWTLSSLPSAGFLADVLPYLQTKREQAEIALAFAEMAAARGRGKGASRSLTDDEVAARRELSDRLKEVRRGA